MVAAFSFDAEVAKFPAYNWLTPDERLALEDDGKIHPTRWFQRKNWGQSGIYTSLLFRILTSHSNEQAQSRLRSSF
jgi:hypothetical protein